MAPPAAATNLREIGAEGFALIDKLYGATTSAAAAPPARRAYATNRVAPARQGRGVVQLPNIDEMEEPPIMMMNSKEVAARFGGVMAVNYYFNPKPQLRRGGATSLIRAYN